MQSKRLFTILSQPFQRKAHIKVSLSDRDGAILMILNKHTMENQLSQSWAGVRVRFTDFHESKAKRCPRKRSRRLKTYLVKSWFYDWCLFFFFAINSGCALKNDPRNPIKHEERKKIKNIFSINRFMIPSFMSFYYIEYIYKIKGNFFLLRSSGLDGFLIRT